MVGWLQRCPGSYSHFTRIGGRRRDSWQLPKLSYSILGPNLESERIRPPPGCATPAARLALCRHSFIVFLRPILPLFCFARFAYFPRRFRPPRHFRVQCLRPLGRPVRAIAILSRATCPTQQPSLRYVGVAKALFVLLWILSDPQQLLIS